MKLYDEGKLRLDDEVKDILPHFNIEHTGYLTLNTLSLCSIIISKQIHCAQNLYIGQITAYDSQSHQTRILLSFQ